jgi:hypothetical protein
MCSICYRHLMIHGNGITSGIGKDQLIKTQSNKIISSLLYFYKRESSENLLRPLSNETSRMNEFPIVHYPHRNLFYPFYSCISLFFH